ncbi:MAG TPA: DUF2169 domain-containing protein, partial [Polyangiaceae bacterium]|nr:DUF2169 domain-containing protein [Polyangiaceae bacterium]
LPLGHPQMRGFAGTYDERWQRERAPWLPIDFDLRAHQVCPPDQWLEGELHGDEPFVVKHLHPRVARLEGRLPGVRIRAWVSFEESGERLVEVPMRLDTVRLWPHRERGVIIHRGLLEVAETDAFDAKLLAVAAERLREGRSSEHYAHAVVGRLHPSRGAAATLDDRDLWNGRTGGAQDDEPPGVLRERLRARADRELDAARAQLAAHGLDPDQYGVPTALSPSTDAPVDPTDLDERLKEVEREGAALKAQAEQQMQRICADAGLDYDTLAAGSHDDASPPDFSAERVARDLAAQLEDAAASGAPQVTTAVDVAALRPTLDEVETLLAACYRRFAHLNTKPPTRPGSASAQLEGAARRGDRLDRVDYTGADVAGANLRGADLSGIYLAGANLRDADLREAKLEGAVLAHADLSGARLDCARLAGVNLGGARLVGATLAHAELRAATLVGAELTEVDVTGASLLACDLSRARFDQATGEGMRIDEGKSLEPLSLSSAKLPGLVVTRSLFVGLDALGADLGASTWERCALVDAVLDDAVLTEASFSETALTGASVLRGANLNAATLVSCTMRGVDAREATLQRAQLERVDWSHARLDRTDWYRAAARSCLFVRAALGEARLVSVNASESLFDRADLTGTDFTGALLYGASLEEVDLAAATFAHAEIGRALLRAPRRMGEGA